MTRMPRKDSPVSGAGRLDRGADNSSAGPGADAVGQARLWLARRGITVPDDDVVRGTPSARGLGDGSLGPMTAHPDAVDAAEDRPPALRGSSLFSGPEGPDADPESVARAIVLRKISAQARTRAELEKALKKKEVPDEAATSVLDRMESVGLIDDPTFARDWIESRQQRRYLSKAALRRELSVKGIERTEIDSALEVVGSDDELQAARALATKKVRSMVGLESHVRHRRLVGMLARRGFSPTMISRVVGETLASLDP